MTLRIAAALLLLALAHPGAAQGTLATRTVFLGCVAYELELAVDPATRERGLMGRTELPARGGMLFAFPDDAPRAFWMKNCLVDIDIAFLDRGGVVVATHRMRAEPPRRPEESEAVYEGRLRHYPSGAPARFAVELSAAPRAPRPRPGRSVDVTAFRCPSVG
jgi:uncharacterized membrane protein (UPF0127 family)